LKAWKMMCLKMTMKCTGLVLLLCIISHSFANSLRDIQKEVKTLDTDKINLLSPASDEKKKEKMAKMTKKEGTPNIFDINIKEHTNYVAPEVILQEGDMIITKEQEKIEEYDNQKGLAKDAIKPASDRWPKTGGGRVQIPYILNADVRADTQKLNAINAAIAKYKELSCIDWVPATTTAQHYVRFINDRGCYSYIGRVTRLANFQGHQPISIGRGCGYLGIVEHEMLHCLGFFHEQSRPDRDSHVQILLQNLQNPGFANNFRKQAASVVESAGQPYDIGSVMHYGSDYFAKPGTNTILRITSNGNVPFRANRAGFSKIDLLQLNAIYQCNQAPKPSPSPNPSPGPGPSANGRTCEGLAQLGLCGYTAVCDLCKTQCTASNTAAIISDIEGTSKCTNWKALGYCTGRYKLWMSKFCMKTCFESNFPRDGACQ